MFILAGKLLLRMLSFMFIYLIHTTTPTIAQPEFLSYYCENAANYTPSGEYRTNLNSLSKLFTTNNPYGFYNLSNGQGNDTVNSVALCRGDVNPDVCLQCLIDSLSNLRQVCPHQKEAIGYYDNCMLRYSNDVILGSTLLKFYVSVANPQNATDIDLFNGALWPLLKDLRGNASAGGPLKKFASGNTSVPGNSTIYGFVQCTPDLSETQCSDCLENIIDIISLYFNGKVGVRILVPMCTFRYETYPFLSQSTRVITPSPPVLQPSPSIPRPSPPPGKKNSATRIVIIIIVIVIFIVTLLFIIMRLRKKKQMIPPPLPPIIIRSNSTTSVFRKCWSGGRRRRRMTTARLQTIKLRSSYVLRSYRPVRRIIA